MNRFIKAAAMILIFIIPLTLFAGCGDSDPAIVTEPAATTETQSLSIPYFLLETMPATEPEDENSIPEKPWELEDWVSTLYQEEFTWTDGVGNLNTVQVSLPCFNPVYDCAISYNDEVRAIGQRTIAEIQACQDSATSTHIFSLSYEAYLNDDILSIVLIHSYDSNYTDYTVHSFDLTEAREVTLTDFIHEYLDLDYPAFLMASNTLIGNEFIEKYETCGTENDADYYSQLLEGVSSGAFNIARRALFLGENGQLMLCYDAPSLAGADTYPTIAPFDVRSIGWTGEPENEDCYNYLFTLALTATDAYDAAACESILKTAFEDNAVHFSKYLSTRSQEDISAIAAMLARGYGIEREKLSQYAGNLKDENVKAAILDAVATVSDNAAPTE